MSQKPRYLTKSRFKTATECPTKLYFTGKPEYGNNKLENAFLKALAEGGFQVGELAKLYHPGGTDIKNPNATEAVIESSELLKAKDITLYEPAIQFENLLVRVDVLVKRGNSIELIEVKAKSFDPTEKDQFYNKTKLKKGEYQLNTEWLPYLYDIAFQTYVVRKAFPDCTVTSALMLADKSKVATVDGLNQRFFLETDSKGRTHAMAKESTTAKDLGEPILVKVPVDSEVALVLKGDYDGSDFGRYVSKLADTYASDTMVAPKAGKKCKSCEFRIDDKKKDAGLKSGFEECWTQALKLKPEAFKHPLVLDIWNFRKSDDLIQAGRLHMADLDESDIAPKPRDEESGLSGSERQWMQVHKVASSDPTPYFDIDGLSCEMESWTYPLHFIDFETTMAAIPFNKGRRPYEQIAFQFSHHVITEKGEIEHRSEYINRERGKFPNFEFVRELKKVLTKDSGTIFRYATHENTVLCQIREQLLQSAEPEPDQAELIAFIESITTSTKDSVHKWAGPRSMVDLCDLVKRYYYHPATRGSNSIKKVLPAILGDSQFLQQKYGQPVYGAKGGVKSKNFNNWQWIQTDAKGVVTDPYKLLPQVFTDIDLETMDALVMDKDDSFADGGAAMTAYARMQFTEMSEAERVRVTEALLRYCELDTFAMVIIYEYWKHEVAARKRKAA